MDATVFEVIVEIRSSKKMTTRDQRDLLWKLTELDEKVVSIDHVFTGTMMPKGMQRIFSLKVEARTPEAAVRHVQQNYGLLLTNCYYKPPAEPAGKKYLPQ